MQVGSTRCLMSACSVHPTSAEERTTTVFWLSSAASAFFLVFTWIANVREAFSAFTCFFENARRRRPAERPGPLMRNEVA